MKYPTWTKVVNPASEIGRCDDLSTQVKLLRAYHQQRGDGSSTVQTKAVVR